MSPNKYHYSKFDRWLEYLGFRANPFAYFDADLEHDIIPNTYVSASIDPLDDLLDPHFAIITSEIGCGKTATREIVSYLCYQTDYAFPVTISDFTFLLSLVERDIERLNENHYVEAIIRQALKELAQKELSYDNLDESQAGNLFNFALRFSDPLTISSFEKIATISNVKIPWESLTASEILSEFVNIITRISLNDKGERFRSLCILIDHVDKSPLGSNDQTIIELLRPLISSRSLISLRNVDFRFFLPKSVGLDVSKILDITYPQYFIHEITWNNENLERMVSQRLMYFSDGRISHFDEICSGNIFSRLTDLSKNSPRALIQLCQAVIRAHTNHSNSEDSLLSLDDFKIVLASYKNDLESGDSQIANHSKKEDGIKVFLCHSTADKESVRVLFRRLNKDGFDVWFDEEKLIGGQDWESVIPMAVRNADVVAVCLSKSSINKKGYVQKEIAIALDEADRQPEGSIYIIPLKLESCDVPNRLQKWQWVELFARRGYEKLKAALIERKRQLNNFK